MAHLGAYLQAEVACGYALIQSTVYFYSATLIDSATLLVYGLNAVCVFCPWCFKSSFGRVQYFPRLPVSVIMVVLLDLKQVLELQSQTPCLSEYS